MIATVLQALTASDYSKLLPRRGRWQREALTEGGPRSLGGGYPSTMLRMVPLPLQGRSFQALQILPVHGEVAARSAVGGGRATCPLPPPFACREWFPAPPVGRTG